MNRQLAMTFALTALSLVYGCTRNGVPTTESAVIVGSVVNSGGAGKQAVSAQLACPDIVVTLNGSAVDIELDDDCTFLIDEVAPSENVLLTVELPDLGVSGTVELANVEAAEFIEILVEADEDSLTLSVVRRATPEPVGTLPLLVDGNNVTIFLAAGEYDQDLTVDGNNFTLVGESGEDCDDEGWTVITGDVLVLKNNATFRNIRFDGTVQVEGNNATFINTCFGSDLLIFGNNTEINGNGEDDDGEDDDDDEGGDDNGGGENEDDD